MAALARVEVMLRGEVDQALDDLLVFDARCVDVPTRQELLRLLPQLLHLRRAWRAHYQEHGCLGCQKPDPTVAIAARLRRRGMPWSGVYEVVGLKRAAMTTPQRKEFEGAVRWRMAHLDVAEQKPSQRYGAGGFCDRCYLRLRRELANRIRLLHEGRDPENETKALTRKFDVAQTLLRGDE